MSGINRKRLKIGIFLDSFYPEIDGVVMVTDNVACALAEFNDVTLIIPDMGIGEDYKRPYDIIKVKSFGVPFSNYKAGILTGYSKEYKQILAKDFDVIHVHSPFVMGKTGVKIAKKCNVPVFGTVHSRYYYEVKKLVKSELFTQIVMKYIVGVYNACDRCVVVNAPVADDLRKFGYKYEPIVIPNATDILPPKDKEGSIQRVYELYHLKEDDVVLLYVGRISSTKNIFFILESLKLLKEDGVRFKMLYVGFGPDEEKMKNKIREYGLDDCVFMTGKISDREWLSSVYARADLFLFPSPADAFGLVILEAAVNETPCLLLEDTMSADLVEDNVNGFVSPAGEEKYKNRIKEILSDRELLRKVSENAKDTLAENWTNIAEKTYNEYVKAIREKSKQQDNRRMQNGNTGV